MRTNTAKWIATGLGTMSAGALHAAALCEGVPASDPNLLIHDGQPAVHMKSVPAMIRVGEPFDLHLTPCVDAVTVVSADAGMPSHGHGMNYRPKVETTGKGAIRARGFLFHMPGTWEIRVLVQGEGREQVLLRSVEVSP